MDAKIQYQPKTRSSAKEAVSSRWASRAEQSIRVKHAAAAKLQMKQQTFPHPQSRTSTPASTPQKSSLMKASAPSTPNAPIGLSIAQAKTPIHQICKTWKQVQHAIGSQLLRHLAREQKLYEPNRTHGQYTNVQSHQSARRKNNSPSKKVVTAPQRKANKDQLAKTLTNIRVSTALQNQLAEITQGESKKYLKSVLSILPAGFDQSSALTSSIQNRKRAFLLMDFGRVIRAHAQFIAYTCGFGDTANSGELPLTHKLQRMRGIANNVGRKRKGMYIQPQFKVMKNPSLELLKLLTRLGVDLRCNSSDDVMAASHAIEEERSERYSESGEDVIDTMRTAQFSDEASVLVDDVSKSRKPNGYFRRLIKAQSNRYQMNRVDMAVDGVDEVSRISNTLKQLAKRNSNTLNNNTSKIDMDGFRIILRLPPAEREKHQNGTWVKLVLAVHAAATEVNCDLVGVSVNLSLWSDSLNTADEEPSERILEEICTHLRIFRLLMLTVGQYHIRIDMTGLPYPLNRDNSEKLTNCLKRVICCDVAKEELMQLLVNGSNSVDNDSESEETKNQVQTIVEMANDPSTSSVVFTADVSDHLVAQAGALCTRIIGVKSGKVSDENTDEIVRVSASVKHYYIDDGCYGSLGSAKCGSENASCSGISECKEENSSIRVHRPIPLYGRKFTPKGSHLILKSGKKGGLVANSSTEGDQSVNVMSTVWGPTCDGLDKVCDQVLLPSNLQANRDWLVFSNLGCGGFGGGLGLGTAFNGFDPPDVSYCVLGYFAHVVEQ